MLVVIGFAISSSINDSKTDVQSKLSKYIDNYSVKNKFSGTILIAKDDEVILDKGYGMADYNKNIVDKPKTVFEIASLTKQVTATAILMLQEKKFLSVQDTIPMC
ncbi:beta-lactamase family protein [Clostridium frigoris]|uniref:Beta-lactamase family protein n=1 Tax=Clostridium frigoris TaxID=205327 RepID=A0ABS6BYQ1_9CLOT|nr:serine hydrolase domain-containing protein [Clostridium frigoris]MBU3161728.1 beta-lactamase family protein [Clostridium frigoris]